MDQPDTKTAPAVQPEARSVPKYEFFTIIGTIVGIGIALGAVLLDNTHRLDSAIAEASADRRAADAKMDEFRAEAAADRRAFQASMDEYRRDMRRLGERQARLEGQREGAAQQ